MNKTLDQVLGESLRPVFTQMDYASTNLSGTALASLQAAGTLLNNAAAAVIEQYNAEVDQYNDAIDAIAERDEQLINKATAIGLMQVQVNDLTAQLDAERLASSGSVVLIQEMQASIDNLNAQIRVSKSDFSAMKREMDAMNSLNPLRMQDQIAQLKKKLADRQKLDNDRELQMKEMRTTAATQKSKIASMVNALADMEAGYQDMRSRVSRMDGEMFGAPHIGTDGTTRFYPYLYNYNLKARASDPDCRMMDDLQWHLAVWSDNGTGTLVNINDLGAPVFSTVDSFNKCWPDSLTRALQEKIIDLMRDTHPLIADRYDWATDFDVTAIDMPVKYQTQLAESGVNNLYDIIRRTPDQLAHDVKGFGVPTARQVRAQCMGIVKDWETGRKKQEKAA